LVEPLKVFETVPRVAFEVRGIIASFIACNTEIAIMENAEVKHHICIDRAGTRTNGTEIGTRWGVKY